jgi:hypothetical protein
MKLCYLSTLLLLPLSLSAVEKEYTIDFSESFSMDAFARAGVPLEIPPSVAKEPNRRTLPNDTRYVFKLPSSNTFVFEAHMGHIAFAYKDEGSAGRIVLYGNKPQYHLTTEESLSVLERFHETFEIPKEPLYEWFKPIQNGQLASSFYQAIAKKQYPEVALELANSFFEDKPVFLVFYLDFDEKTLRKRGVSAKTNKVTNLTFDVPAIIESVRAQSAPAIAADPIEEPAAVSRTAAQEPTEEAEVKAAAETLSVKVAQEAPEESTNWLLWLLWLIGALVVLGGLALVVRRKN